MLATVVSMQYSTTLSQNMQICLQILFQVLGICTCRICNADMHSRGSGFEKCWVWGGCPFSQDASAESFWYFSGIVTSEGTVAARTLIQQIASICCWSAVLHCNADGVFAEVAKLLSRSHCISFLSFFPPPPTKWCLVSAHPDVIITISEFVFSAPTTFHFSSICQEYYPPSHPSHSIHSLILMSLALLISILWSWGGNTNKVEKDEWLVGS